jgi:serine-type D-Ala-D-Ala carboxypeptidase (penicillin-binding protein 5/6)
VTRVAPLADRAPAGAALALACALCALLLALGAARPATAHAAPSVRAPAGILVEPATGDVVWSRSARERRSIASTTKLMTALLTLERMRLGATVSATRYRGLAVESVIGLRAGERLTVADLLRGLLLASANDAAATLAARIGGSRSGFVRLMNRRARELKLEDTHYANPIGLDDAGNYSSAEDLVKLALILRRNEFFRRVTNLPRATLKSGSRPRTVVNRNLLVRGVAAVNGVKTGHTLRAGYVLVGSASRNGVTVISAVLGDASEAARDADSLSLLRYGLGRYRRVTPVREGERFATATLRFRDEERVRLVATRTVRRTARRDEKVTTRVLDAPRELDGPLPKGARVGTIEVRWRGEPVDRVALVTAEAVEEASLLQRLDGVVGRTLLVVAAAVLALGSLQAVLLRRRRLQRRRRPTGGTEVA